MYKAHVIFIHKNGENTLISTCVAKKKITEYEYYCYNMQRIHIQHVCYISAYCPIVALQKHSTIHNENHFLMVTSDRKWV